jgi:hypothetical protein
MTESQQAERVERAEKAVRLARAEAAQGCPCGHPDWRVYHTSGRTRYVKCRSCGRAEKIVAG